MDFDSAYIYGANFIAKFRWESGFLGGSMELPLGHQRKQKYLGHLSVKLMGMIFSWTNDLLSYNVANIIYSYLMCSSSSQPPLPKPPHCFNTCNPPRPIPTRILYKNRLKPLLEYIYFNGWQLAKMKKSIPDMSLPWNLQGWSSWSKKLQKYLKNYDICENVKFGAISWKFDIFSITA